MAVIALACKLANRTGRFGRDDLRGEVSPQRDKGEDEKSKLKKEREV